MKKMRVAVVTWEDTTVCVREGGEPELPVVTSIGVLFEKNDKMIVLAHLIPPSGRLQDGCYTAIPRRTVKKMYYLDGVVWTKTT